MQYQPTLLILFQINDSIRIHLGFDIISDGLVYSSLVNGSEGSEVALLRAFSLGKEGLLPLCFFFRFSTM